MAEHERDGSYYAKDGVVWKRPVETKTAGGSRISIVFPVCKMSDIVGEEGAETVAELMNQGDAIPLLLKALQDIAAIENQEFGPDWAEIEQARKIANDALTTIGVGGSHE
jgi:hypothetical protein